MEESTLELELPGFRFHPTEEELIEFYLKKMVMGKKLPYDIIGVLNIYRHDPWDLPGLAKIGEREWYFFVPRDRKHGGGGRPNRTTENGFWKATGSDRRIFSLSDPKRMIGLKKTLVFYRGRAPRGCKTDWVMNEYRLSDTSSQNKDIVLCKIYRKATSLKVLEQRAAMEEDMNSIIQEHRLTSALGQPMDTISFSYLQNDDLLPISANKSSIFSNKEDEDEVLSMSDEKRLQSEGSAESKRKTCSALQLPNGKLAELQVPRLSMDWTQGDDPIWSLLRSPWLGNLTPCANVLNL